MIDQFQIKYYKYESRITEQISPYGKVWIYKFEPRKDSQKKYFMSIFNRETRQWYELYSADCIPRSFKLISKKELFLELL